MINGAISLGSINGGSSQILNNTVSNGIGVSIGSFTILNNRITGGGVGVSLPTISANDALTDVSNNTISGCGIGVIGNAGSAVTIEGNSILNNKDYGLEILNGATSTADSPAIIGRQKTVRPC